jgi:hypothetical protein
MDTGSEAGMTVGFFHPPFQGRGKIVSRLG